MFVHHPERTSTVSCRCDEDTIDTKTEHFKKRMILDMQTEIESETEADVDVTCYDCGAHFSQKEILIAHQTTYHRPKPRPKIFFCEQCGKEFKSSSNFGMHKLTHMDLPKNYKCDLCDAAFPNKRYLTKHKNSIHVPKNYVCENCGKKFTCISRLKLHLRTHSDDRPFKCELCPATYKRRDILVIHQQSTHGVGPLNTEHKCKWCSEVFPTRVLLVSHYKNHSDEMKFQCERCSQRFLTEKGLKIHEGACDSAPRECRICDKVFEHGTKPCDHIKKKQVSLKRPLEKKKKDFIECEMCGKHVKNIYQHYQVRHSNKRPFQCEICEKSFKTKSILQNHTKSVHLDLRPFNCDFCEKSFPTKERAMIHTRIHTGEKPYVCPICNRGFAQTGDCKKHIKTHDKK